MNIYLLEQDSVNGYDTYDSCVVIAESEQRAREMHPYLDYTTSVLVIWNDEKLAWVYLDDGRIYRRSGDEYTNWAHKPDDVKATLIGSANGRAYRRRQVICASFNAG